MGFNWWDTRFDMDCGRKILAARGNGKSFDDAANAIAYAAHDWMDARKCYEKRNPIKKVIFSGPVTVVLWSDGDKTIVRNNGETFDYEKGLAMAISKKYLGTNENKSNYYDVFKKWIPEEDESKEKEFRNVGELKEGK